MNVLVACEESQRVCIEFRKRGHNAFSCDLQECSGGHPEWHIQGDVLLYLSPVHIFNAVKGIHFQTCDKEYHFVEKWDLIIAHPPCTYMSKAGARWMYPKAGEIDTARLALALAAKKFFLQILNSDCEKIVIENPVPLKIVGLPVPTQKIQPFEFGEPFSKCTLLWVKGNLPLLKPTDIVKNYKPYLPSNTGGFSRGRGGSRGVVHNAKEASKTFYGIAKAMAEQWG